MRSVQMTITWLVSGGNYGDGKATSGGPPQHQEGCEGRQTQAYDWPTCLNARGQPWANKAPKWLAESEPPKGDEPGDGLFASHGDVENGALTVDQEQSEIARFHRIGEPLKRREVRDGLAI